MTSLLVADEISGGQFGSVWRTWWLGDLGGDLIVAPALFVAAHALAVPARTGRAGRGGRARRRPSSA